MATKPKKNTPEQPGADQQHPVNTPGQTPETPTNSDPIMEHNHTFKQQPIAPNRLAIVVQLTCCLIQTPRYAGEFFQKDRRAIVLAKAVELADEIIAATES